MSFLEKVYFKLQRYEWFRKLDRQFTLMEYVVWLTITLILLGEGISWLKT